MYHTACRLAGLDYDGLSVEQDIPAAMELFQRCIDEQNHVEAKADLARLLEYDGKDDDINDPSKSIRQIALYESLLNERNNPEDKLRLARLLFEVGWRIHQQNQILRAVELYESYIEETADYQAIYDLAGILAEGAPGMEKDVSRALDLLENGADEADEDAYVMSKIVEIILCGAAGNEEHVGRAMQMFKTYFDGCYHMHDAPNLVCRLISEDRQRHGLSTKTSYAVLLLETCIEKWNDAHAMIILADLLFVGAPGVERDADRGWQLCATALELGVDQDILCSEIGHSVRSIVYESWWTSENAILAIQLCELCIEKGNSHYTELLLAEILMAEGAGVDKDAHRALQLCENYLRRSETCGGVIKFLRNVAYGTYGIQRDVRFAVQLCEMCVEKKNDETAMMMLVEIFLSGAPGIEQNVDRAIDLCEKSLSPRFGTFQSCHSIIDLAKKLVYKRFGTSEHVAAALQLCEMCIEKANETDAMLLLAELLSTQCSDIENTNNRVISLCQKYLEIRRSCYGLADLVKKIVSGASGKVANMQVAVQICELCTENLEDKDITATLAEILMSGAAGVEEDIDRGLQLCKNVISGDGWTQPVSDLARMIAFGRCGKRQNILLAIQLCEMCIEKNDEIAMLALAEILESEEAGSEKDLDRATKLKKDSFLLMKEMEGMTKFRHLRNVVEKIAFGTGRMKQNVSLAIEFCEMFILTGDRGAMVALAKILLLERNNAEDTGRGLQMCQKSVDNSNSSFELFEIVDLARRVMYGECRMAEKNPQLALELIEICIARVDGFEREEWELGTEKFPVAVAEVLIATGTDSTHVERAMQLCQVAINDDGSGCRNVARVARNIAFGIDGMTRNPLLAVTLCKMCIEKKRDPYAFITLAEIFIAGTSQVQKNINYALELCEQSVTENRHENVISCLARSIAAGTDWMKGDARLAVQLCEMCVTKRRDVQAMVVLSEIYSMGTCGVEMDVCVAHEWYQRAVDEGWLLVEYGEAFEYLHNLPNWTHRNDCDMSHRRFEGNVPGLE